MNDKYVYPYSYSEAKRSEQVDVYKNSKQLNIECKDAITQSTNNSRIKPDAIENLIDKYGFDRVELIFANTVQELNFDGRINDGHKEWAKDISFLAEFKEVNPYDISDLRTTAHPSHINVLLNQLQNVVKSKELWTDNQLNPPEDIDFTNKIMVLKHQFLKDEYKTGDFQLFVCTGGVGCSPDGVGRTVRGTYLKDDDNGAFAREDFKGEAKVEFLPKWAKDKLAEMESIKKPSVINKLNDVKNDIANTKKDVEPKKDKGER